MKNGQNFLIVTLLLFSTMFGGTWDKTAAEEMYVELSMEEKKQTLIDVANKYDIPPEILQAIAYEESKMMQFKDGEPIISNDGGIGIMQITDRDIPNVDYELLKSDTKYNIEVGARILVRKLDYQSDGSIPIINDGNQKIIENWYFAVMAYNGMSASNSPKLETAYQNRVFNRIEEKSHVEIAALPNFELTYKDGILVSSGLLLEWNGANSLSTQRFSEGDEVIVMNSHDSHIFDYGNLRSTKGTNGDVIAKVPYYTNLKIISGPYVDNEVNNHFVYYRVQGDGYYGYMASSNLRSIEETSANYSTWESSTDSVSVDKEWTISFNTTLNENSVHPKNVYFVDEYGNGVRSKVSLDDSGKKVIIKPRNDYIPGTTYRLFIKDIKSTTNKLMTKPIEKVFSVEKPIVFEKEKGDLKLTIALNATKFGQGDKIKVSGTVEHNGQEPYEYAGTGVDDQSIYYSVRKDDQSSLKGRGSIMPDANPMVVSEYVVQSGEAFSDFAIFEMIDKNKLNPAEPGEYILQARFLDLIIEVPIFLE
jgi:hypothetical protein